MSLKEINNKQVVIYGSDLMNQNFVNFLTKYDIRVIILNSNNITFNIETNKLVSYSNIEDIQWQLIECLITNKFDSIIDELSKKYNFAILSIANFFIKYFPEYNYIGLIGETGSSISSDLIKHILSRLELNLEYNVCQRDDLFTLTKFTKTNNYVFEVEKDMLSTEHNLPKFNNIILFDLDYSNTEKERIKKNILDRSNSKLIVLNIDNKEIKDFYNEIKDMNNELFTIIPISIQKILKYGVSFINNEIYVNQDNNSTEYITKEFPFLNGEQNKLNILSVFALLYYHKYNIDDIIENIYSFKPCDDVFEMVLHTENYSFINDIKNKNKEQSLNAFDNIYWILCIDDIKYEFNYFHDLTKYFNKIKYIFVIGTYNDELLKIFRDNEIQYFVMYSIKDILEKVNYLSSQEEKEEKITILLSSINDLDNNDFYNKCSDNFDKLVNNK